MNDKATMSKNVCQFVDKYCTLLPTFICLNTWSFFLDISLCALLISRPSYQPKLLGVGTVQSVQ